MTPLYNTDCYKSMHDLTEERKMNLFSPIEILVMDSLKKNLDCGIDFITVNEDGLFEHDPHELFKALDHLVKLHIIRKRDCDGIAYEWDDKYALLRILR